MEDSYETEEEELIRLNLDNTPKVKLELNKVKKSKNLKYNLLTEESISGFNQVIEDKILPNLKIGSFEGKEDLNALFSLNNSNHKVEKKEETGTNLFFHLDEGKIEFMGKSGDYLEVRNKLYPRKERAKKKESSSPTLNRKRRKIVQSKSKSIKRLRKIQK